MKSEMVENWWCGFEWCILNTQKVWSSSKFKKLKSLSNRRVSVWNPDTSKEIVHFVHEVHLVFAIPSQLFSTFYVGEMMIPCQLWTFSEIICSAFHFQGHIAKKIVNAWKVTQMKSERVENWWCGFEWCILNTHEVWSSNKFKKMKSLCNRRVSI